MKNKKKTSKVCDQKRPYFSVAPDGPVPPHRFSHQQQACVRSARNRKLATFYTT
jgi:hypothetical protein